MEKKLISENLIRIDKNIAYNINSFDTIEDAQTRDIIKSLLIYFSFKEQSKDLFNFSYFDPHHFAQVMKLDRANLMRKNKNAICLVKENNLEFKWETYLENALFFLFTNPIFEEYKGSTSGKNFTGLRNYLIIKEIRCFHPDKKGSGKPKKFYHYKLDEYFENNLKNFFFNISLPIYVEMKKINVEDFYLVIKNIYNQAYKKGINEYQFSFDIIKEYLNVSSNTIKDQKYKINKIFKKIEIILSKEIPGFKFSWIKGPGQNYAYVPVMKWDKMSQEEIKKITTTIYDSIFLEELRNKYYQTYTKHISERKTGGGFWQWLFDTDKTELINIFIETHISKYGAKATYPSKEILAASFVDKIKKIKSLEEIKSLFDSK